MRVGVEPRGGGNHQQRRLHDEAGEVNQEEEQGHNDERENEDDVWGPQPCKVKLARTSQSEAPITLEPQEDNEKAELADHDDFG